MKASERVLSSNGTFEEFPERLREKAIAQGNDTAKPDEGEAENLVAKSKAGKAEIAKIKHDEEKAQIAMDKKIKADMAKKIELAKAENKTVNA